MCARLPTGTLDAGDCQVPLYDLPLGMCHIMVPSSLSLVYYGTDKLEMKPKCSLCFTHIRDQEAGTRMGTVDDPLGGHYDNQRGFYHG